MVATELQEIKDYWAKKYPNVVISIYPTDEGKYFGKMMGVHNTVDLFAETVGELISQCEAFLRKLSNGNSD